MTAQTSVTYISELGRRSRSLEFAEWQPTACMPCPIINKCARCKEFKSIFDFYFLKTQGRSGRRTTNGKRVGIYCKQCQSNQYKESSTESKIFHACKKRAKEKGLEFTLELADIKIPSHCPMLGIPLYPTSGQAAHANSPSLDRLDPRKGYTPENTAIISHRANTIKNNATPEELRLIADYTERALEERSNAEAA
jgi:hypothetical protein